MDALLHMEGTATRRAVTGDEWTLDQHLLAIIADRLGIIAWQRTKDGRKNRNRPKPLSPLAKAQGTRYGKTDRSDEEVKAYLARFGPPPT